MLTNGFKAHVRMRGRVHVPLNTSPLARRFNCHNFRISDEVQVVAR